LATGRVERRLAAIFVADVVGYSRLMGADEEGTHERLKAHLSELVEPKIDQHHGHTVKNTGDGMLAEFPSVVDATRCAIELQRGMVEREREVPDERRIRFRIGINLGDVIVEPEDIFGDGVNIAARLQALAQPGTVCISQTVYDQVKNKLDLDYLPLGAQRVKNIAEPVRAYGIGLSGAPPRRRSRHGRLVAAGAAAVVVTGGLVAWAYYAGAGHELSVLGVASKPVEVASLAAPAHLTGRPSVAVLPFQNLSGDAGQDFFSDGITEDVITALGRFSNLLVVARSASFQFKSQKLAPAEIARRLDARYLLEGSVRRAAERVRVTAELSEAATGRNVWSQSYDGEVNDIFGVQEDIDRRVVGAAAVKLTRFERERAFGKPTNSLAAYEYVLRGREVFSHATRESNHEAQGMFQRAIDLDPSYSAAYSALGLSLIEAVTSGWTEFIADDISRAEALAQKALSLDPASTAAYHLLAVVDLDRGRLDLALDQTDRALEINPSDAESYNTRGSILVWAGRAAEALPWLEGALRFDRADARASLFLGMAYYLLHRYGEVVERIDRALVGNLGRNTQLLGRPVLAAAYAQLNRPLDAERERAAAIRLSPFLDAERFAGQFGTQETRDQMLEGLKKAGFR